MFSEFKKHRERTTQEKFEEGIEKYKQVVEETGTCRYCKYLSKTKKQNKVEYDMVLFGHVILCDSCATILGIGEKDEK